MKVTNLKHIMDRPSGGALVANNVQLIYGYLHPGGMQDFCVVTIVRYYKYKIRDLAVRVKKCLFSVRRAYGSNGRALTRESLKAMAVLPQTPNLRSHSLSANAMLRWKEDHPVQLTAVAISSCSQKD